MSVILISGILLSFFILIVIPLSGILLSLSQIKVILLSVGGVPFH